MNKIQLELLQNKQMSTEEKREITISLTIIETGRIELDLSYVIMDARWSSSYDVRVDTEKETCKLIYYGNIINTTGEDWKEVDLSLSTAEPSIGYPPPLYPIHVQFEPPLLYHATPKRRASIRLEEEENYSDSDEDDDSRGEEKKKEEKKKHDTKDKKKSQWRNATFLLVLWLNSLLKLKRLVPVPLSILEEKQ